MKTVHGAHADDTLSKYQAQEEEQQQRRLWAQTDCASKPSMPHEHN